MARPLRIQFENACYHVTCRGNTRQKIFTNDEDRQTFLQLLARSGKIYQIEILGFVMRFLKKSVRHRDKGPA